MGNETVVAVYCFGAIVYGLSLVEKWEVIDVIASAIVGLTWPIHLPARIIKRILR